jgi:hypothetical protein
MILHDTRTKTVLAEPSGIGIDYSPCSGVRATRTPGYHLRPLSRSLEPATVTTSSVSDEAVAFLIGLLIGQRHFLRPYEHEASE